jgi:hypothetical protein
LNQTYGCGKDDSFFDGVDLDPDSAMNGNPWAEAG